MVANWDYIIVGGGTAGCVLANRLSANPGNRVLLLEAGGTGKNPILHVPAGVISAVFSDKFNWKYPALPDRSRNSISDRWSGGKVLGGSSSINGMLFMRGHPSDYDRWANMGCEGWDYASLLPFFRSIETFSASSNRNRGDDGPLSVTLPAHFPAIADEFIGSAQRCGHPFNEDYNVGESAGVSVVQSSIKHGRRHSAASAFLDPIKSRKNLEIHTNAQVSEILFEGRNAVGVAYTWKGEKRSAFCNREVIVSSGAIGSPRLLMLSGVGPPDLLLQLGIPVRHAAPNVGANLMEHPGVYVSAKSNMPTFNSAARPSRLPGVILNWLLFGRGPAAVGTALAQVLSRSSPSLAAPDLQLLLSLATFSINEDGKGASLGDDDGISIACCLLEPKSRGSVRIVSRDPSELPQVDHALLGDEDDVERLAMAAKNAMQILEDLREQGVISSCEFSVARDAPASEWVAHLRQTAFRADHPSGTCAMGPDEDAVVDPQLRVRGVNRLRVVDTSVAPLIPNANTCATALVIAERASQMILESWRA